MLRGSGDALWTVSSVKSKRTVMDYDSGPLLEDNPDDSSKVVIQRKCRFYEAVKLFDEADRRSRKE